jgi:hypothetical protein
LRAPRSNADGSEADERQGLNSNSTAGTRTNSLAGPTSAIEQDRRLGTSTVARGTLTQDEAFRQRSPADSVQASQDGRFRPPGSQIGGRPQGNGVFDFPPPPGAENVLYGPGGYGFMEQYSGRSRTTGSGSTERTQGSNPSSGTPNYFNGSYSRSRL